MNKFGIPVEKVVVETIPVDMTPDDVVHRIGIVARAFETEWGFKPAAILVGPLEYLAVIYTLSKLYSHRAETFRQAPELTLNGNRIEPMCSPGIEMRLPPEKVSAVAARQFWQAQERKNVKKA